MRQILLLKYPCEDVLAHLDNRLKVFKIKYTYFEDDMGCIHTDKSNNISPITNYIYMHVNFFRYRICNKYTNP